MDSYCLFRKVVGKSMRAFLFLFGGLFAAPVSMAAPFVFPNAFGPYGVGLKVVQQYDETRPYHDRFDIVTGQIAANRDKHARPIQTLVWYPAEKSGKAMAYGDYVALAASQDRFDRSPVEVSRMTAAASLAELGYLKTNRTARISQIMGAPVHAARDAAAVAGPFPVLVYAPSDGGSAFEQSDLCEYLASQGYIVIASSTQGAHGPYMTDDLEGLEAQAADIRFLIGYANSLPQADISRLAVIGYSWGGMANALAAAKDSRIKALVDLDGSVRYFPDLVKSAGYLTPRSLSVPLLFLADKEDPIEPGKDVQPQSLINQLIYSDVYKIGMHPLSHEDFASDTLHFYNADDPNESSIDALSEGYGWMARYVLEFLNAELKNSPSGKAFLSRSPAANGVPARVLSFQSQPHKAAEVTLEIFASRLSQQRFEHAVALYAELRKVDPSFELTENTLEPWGLTLLRQGQIAAAIEIFELQVSIFPKDANAYGDLAYAQIANNDHPAATKTYRQALQLAPGNADLQHSFKKLMAADSNPAVNTP